MFASPGCTVQAAKLLLHLSLKSDDAAGAVCHWHTQACVRQALTHRHSYTHTHAHTHTRNVAATAAAKQPSQNKNKADTSSQPCAETKFPSATHVQAALMPQHIHFCRRCQRSRCLRLSGPAMAQFQKSIVQV